MYLHASYVELYYLQLSGLEKVVSIFSKDEDLVCDFLIMSKCSRNLT